MTILKPTNSLVNVIVLLSGGFPEIDPVPGCAFAETDKRREMKFRCIAFLLVLLGLQVYCSESGLVLTLLAATTDPTDTSHGWDQTYCGVYYNNWGDVPSVNKPKEFYPSSCPSGSDPNACADIPPDVEDHAVIVREGNCTFYDQATTIQSANASLLVIVFGGSDLSQLSEMKESFNDGGNVSISLPVVFVENGSGNEILLQMNSSGMVYLSAYSSPLASFDPSVAVIICIAIFVVFMASYIANTPFEFLRYGLLVRKGESYGRREEPDTDSCSGKRGVLGIVVMIVIFVMVICLLLMLLYLFYYPMVYVVIALFCLGAMVGLYVFISPFVALIPLFNNCRLPPNKLPVLEFRPDPKFFLSVAFCIGVVVWWVVERHAVYAWILQDFLGFTFITLLLHRLLFLRMWIVAVLMIPLFFYDIFMVFITPFFTEDHESVMVKAATGGEGSTEQLPIVFVVPKFLSSEIENVCADYLSYFPASLLGYGDVGIPGLLVALSLKFDYDRRPKKCFKIYYAVSGIAYTVGLMITVVALSLMETPQPALLYLVPATLGSVTVTALIRREFVLFFTGKPYSKDKRGRSTDSTNLNNGGPGSTQVQRQDYGVEENETDIDNERAALIEDKQ